MQLAEIAKLAQSCFQACPTIVIGSGASIPHGLPSMLDLANYLIANLNPTGEAETKSWTTVRTALEKGNHLEQALEGQSVPPDLLRQIVAMTWRCVNEKDAQLLDLAVNSPDHFPLSRLVTAMFSSTHSSLQIVTTNYDRVIEYACNSAGILFQTGFAPGYVQKWEASNRIKFHHGAKPSRVVNIWKVHGSLDWFRTQDERTIGLPAHQMPGDSYTPLIVTPGLNKFEKTYEDPFRTTINGADNALSSASSFLCIGFGFRDQHIHPKIIERCRERNVPIVVLARTLTVEAKEFLAKNAGTKYLALEKKEDGSTLYSPEHPDGLDLSVENIWSLPGFNSLVI
ncbi:SIR2 family protein [Rhodovulum tesquicola]|uniref:SIR2 family protein n=1 Tax=Rhodovulum tesquicola TaxID=540254 RepID=UPI002098403B|nr:SIR2 family protein [Rhodovulum tesquicola]MCO8146895.1 SIR2 family protein [Rhodovulum tesquicola]